MLQNLMLALGVLFVLIVLAMCVCYVRARPIEQDAAAARRRWESQMEDRLFEAD